MGPRSDNRGYGVTRTGPANPWQPSMGPRSDNRGYGRPRPPGWQRMSALQWVHGPITVVMDDTTNKGVQLGDLQWVHGPITVVMAIVWLRQQRPREPSMGPRSDNRGYGGPGRRRGDDPGSFNGSTVR